MIALGQRHLVHSRSLLLAALALCLWGMQLSTAMAHSQPVQTLPKAGAKLDAPPKQISLTFNEPIGKQFAQVRISDGSGAQRAVGAAQVAGSTVTQEVASGAAGTWTVAYRVVSADGHPVSSSYTMKVAAGSAPADSSTSPSASSTLPSTKASPTPSASASNGTSSGPGWWVGALGAALVTSLALIAAWFMRRRPDRNAS